MTQGELLKARRKDKGLTLEDVARKLDTIPQTIYKYEHDITKNIPYERIVQLARIYETDPATLLGWETDKPKKKARRIPVYGRIAAGLPIEAVQDIDDWEEVPAEWSGDFLALRVQGDSMTPRICSGDVVIIRRQPTAEDGQIAACYVNGYDATLKRIQHAGDQIILMANNPAFPPQIYPAKDVTILGVVVELRAKF